MHTDTRSATGLEHLPGRGAKHHGLVVSFQDDSRRGQAGVSSYHRRRQHSLDDCRTLSNGIKRDVQQVLVSTWSGNRGGHASSSGSLGLSESKVSIEAVAAGRDSLPVEAAADGGSDTESSNSEEVGQCGH